MKVDFIAELRQINGGDILIKILILISLVLIDYTFKLNLAIQFTEYWIILAILLSNKILI